MVRIYAAAMAVLILFPALARADGPYTPSSLTAAEVLKRADAADGKALPGIVQIVRRTRIGGLDRVRTSFVDGEGYVAHTSFGPFATADGSYRGQDWTQDENGLVTLASNFQEREDPNAVALRHPEDPANRVTVLGTTGDVPARIVLDVNPPGGFHQILSYDAATFLLASVTSWPKDRQKHVDTFSDYRTDLGQTRAYRETSSDGRAENDAVTDILSIARAKAPLPDMHIPSGTPLFAFKMPDPIVLPARIIDGHIVIRLTIAGRGLDFLVDSGASSIVIDPGVAHDLGLTAYDRHSDTIGGTFSSSLTRIPEIGIGSLALDNVAAEIGAISEPLEGARVVGLLGHDFLASGVFTLDFKTQKLTVDPPGTAPVADPKFVHVPIESDDGVPRVSAVFEGVAGNFLFDTGAGATILYPTYFSKLRTSERQEGTIDLDMVGGVVPADQFWVNDLIFGGIQYKKIGILVPRSSTADIGAYDGILGRNILQNYLVVFDYANRMIHLQPN